MTFLADTDKHAISSKIREAEQRTSGELVTVIAASSDNYLYIPTLWAALLALLFPGLASLLALPLNVGAIYLVQVSLFIVLALLFLWPPIRSRIVPRSVQYRRASRHAHELFFIEGLHLTAQRTGVMIFVSLAERYVEIIADKGISEHVDDAIWQRIVNDFIDDVHRGQVTDGFVKAVDSCGAVLQEYFPEEKKDENQAGNELPDHLITIGFD